ncbi:Probable dolichyl pyrophosphate Man9GlcNAc2 alpha-1,3-glucosyltransferase [Galdieria sulphuraria]|nr:Probable dolichyl pyrophosphate Man9GlcNAc2 alpha-1,3-glucosyltransferase [Galdieria sulphuraria]
MLYLFCVVASFSHLDIYEEANPLQIGLTGLKMAIPPLASITPEKLVEYLLQGELRSGYIAGSYWLSSDEFFKDVCASVNLLLKAHPNATKFVFHCQLSKVRGPSCAKLFREETATNHRNRAQNTEVFLLEGGFQAFCYKYVSQVRWGHFGNDFLSYQLCVTESYRINS